jgi:hypothetical protein
MASLLLQMPVIMTLARVRGDIHVIELFTNGPLVAGCFRSWAITWLQDARDHGQQPLLQDACDHGPAFFAGCV